jgi:hypothetical protein
VTTRQVEFCEEELLASHPVAEPLIAGGVRCHGGFDQDGDYISPRTLNRAPAIRAWQAGHAQQFGTGLLELGLDAWPEHYPNVGQAAWLIECGAREPIVTALTRIGTVEGFGSMIRHSTIPVLEPCFVEDIRGTATAHLGRGLYEAHARDEAGFEGVGGHRQMWFAARDIAFENPVTEDETETMLVRMGVVSAGGRAGSVPDPAEVRRRAVERRLLSDDIGLDLELLVERMARLLLIEISAFHTFAWAEELLADTSLVAGEGASARLISYVRTDETPHVEYLKTTLSEMRDRTWIGASGRRYPGTSMVGPIWERAVAESLGTRRRQILAVTLAEVEHALDSNSKRDEIIEGFHARGTVRPGPDGSWVSSVPAVEGRAADGAGGAGGAGGAEAS